MPPATVENLQESIEALDINSQSVKAMLRAKQVEQVLAPPQQLTQPPALSPLQGWIPQAHVHAQMQGLYRQGPPLQRPIQGSQPIICAMECPNCLTVGSVPLDCLCLCVVCGQQLLLSWHHPPSANNTMLVPREVVSAKSHVHPTPRSANRSRARPPRPPPEHLWKTKMCIAGKSCKFGDRCWFAHTPSELRGDGGSIPKNWKTTMCRSSG